MTDKSFRRALKPLKRRRRYRRGLGKHGYSNWLHVATHKGGSPHNTCIIHPNSRWLRCDKKMYRSHFMRSIYGKQWVMCYGHFCMSCYGNTCPFCGQQMKVKKRLRSRV